MPSQSKVKLMVAFVLFLTWGLLAVFGKTEIQPFIEFVKMILGGLGVHYLHKQGETK